MKFLREFDEKGHELAKIQGRIFRKSSINGLSSYDFFRVFLNSEQVATMDDLSFLFMYVSEGEIYYRTRAKIYDIYEPEVINQYVMEWIGYFLRTFCYLTKISSKKAFEIIPFSYLKGVYHPYHSLDIRLAVIKVIEDLNIEYNENNTDELVEDSNIKNNDNELIEDSSNEYNDEKLMRILSETR